MLLRGLSHKNAWINHDYSPFFELPNLFLQNTESEKFAWQYTNIYEC